MVKAYVLKQSETTSQLVFTIQARQDIKHTQQQQPLKLLIQHLLLPLWSVDMINIFQF